MLMMMLLMMMMITLITPHSILTCHPVAPSARPSPPSQNPPCAAPHALHYSVIQQNKHKKHGNCKTIRGAVGAPMNATTSQASESDCARRNCTSAARRLAAEELDLSFSSHSASALDCVLVAVVFGIAAFDGAPAPQPSPSQSPPASQLSLCLPVPLQSHNRYIGMKRHHQAHRFTRV